MSAARVSDPERMAITWAAGTLTAHGARLHAIPGTRAAWDVEMPDGSWLAVNTVSDLCDAARSILPTPTR